MHTCRRVNGQGNVHLVDDPPADTVDAAQGEVGDLTKGVWREVEVAIGATLTSVGQ
jgi:hypothetical protein